MKARDLADEILDALDRDRRRRNVTPMPWQQLLGSNIEDGRRTARDLIAEAIETATA